MPTNQLFDGKALAPEAVPSEDEAPDEPSRTDQARQIAEVYASDQRGIIKKLRKPPNWYGRLSFKDMESGKTLALEVVDSNLLSLTKSLPLAQFASVHEGAPA